MGRILFPIIENLIVYLDLLILREIEVIVEAILYGFLYLVGSIISAEK